MGQGFLGKSFWRADRQTPSIVWYVLVLAAIVILFVDRTIPAQHLTLVAMAFTLGAMASTLRLQRRIQPNCRLRVLRHDDGPRGLMIAKQTGTWPDVCFVVMVCFVLCFVLFIS